MSQRNLTSYKRRHADRYETPPWATEVLLRHLPRRVKTIREPAAASGKMVKVLRKAGYTVRASDIRRGNRDFLKPQWEVQCVITNPPYSHAKEFIEKALRLTKQQRGVVAMLLRVDFDSAKGYRHLFADHPAFCKKIILTQRIRWIEGSTGSPSVNHAWFVWSWTNKKKPTICYEPSQES